MADKDISIINNTLLDKYDDCFEVVSYNHFKFCPCWRKEAEEYASKVLEKYKVQRDLEERKRFFDYRPDATEEEYLSTVSEYIDNIAFNNVYEDALRAFCKDLVKRNIKCHLEKKSALDTLYLFQNKYNDYVDDPIFVEVVKSVINHKLVVERLKRVSSDIGAYQTWVDKSGNERIAINPLLEAQREFDKIKVDALMLLDKKLNGMKNLNINVNLDMASAIEEVFEKRINQ